MLAFLLGAQLASLFEVLVVELNETRVGTVIDIDAFSSSGPIQDRVLHERSIEAGSQRT